MILALQLLVVVIQERHNHLGELQRYERATPQQEWQPVGSSIPVQVGRHGLAHLDEKVEGDGKSPAGTFRLGPAFGDEAHRHYALHIPYIFILEDSEWVDDPASRHYNRYVTQEIPRDWQSSEKMAEIGNLYALGVVIQYNQDPVQPGKGSAIFMHIQSDHNRGTAGCTVMQEDHLIEIVKWLDSSKHPVIQQRTYAIE